jgi:hypothetical protein
LEKEHDKSEGCNAKLIPCATFCCPEFRVQAKKQTVRSGLRDTTHTKHWAHLRTTVKKIQRKPESLELLKISKNDPSGCCRQGKNRDSAENAIA